MKKTVKQQKENEIKKKEKIPKKTKEKEQSMG